MRLHRVRLEDVRGVATCDVAFAADGVTIVEAPNEAGKTTLLDAVDVLFDYKDSSTAQVVRDLAPVGRDVGSLVEVELTCGEVHLTCRKRFNRQRETVLQVHAPSREQLTGDEAHDRLQAILESDVDLALYRALRLQQGRDLDALVLADSDALAARLDAAAGGGGDPDDDALLGRAEELYERYFTLKTGRPKRTLTELDGEVAELEGREAELVDQQRALATDAEEVARIEVELPELERRLTDDLAPALADQQERLERIRSVRERVATRRAERDRAVAALVAARRDRQERAELVERLAELVDEVGRLDEELGPAREALAAAEAQLASREQALSDAAEAARAAKRERDRADQLVELVTASEERDRLLARHERVRAVTEAAAEASEALARIVLDDDRLETIRDADREVRVARAALQAGAPVVRLEARRDLEIAVDGAPLALTAGDAAERTVEEGLAVDVPDVLALEVTAGTSASELHRRVATAEAALADACDEARVADLEEAEEVATERRRHEATLRRRDDALERELDGATPEELAAACRAAEEQVAALEARLADDVEPADLTTARQRADQARTQAAAADAAAEEARDARDATATAVQEQREATGRREVLLEQRREELERRRSELEAARADTPDEVLEQAVAAAATEDETAAAALAEVEEELAALEPDQVELAVEAARAEHDNATARIRELRERRVALQARLDTMGAAGVGEALEEVRAQLERRRIDQRRTWARARAAEALYTTLRAARDEAYRAYREPLRERIVAQARLLYGDDDVDVELGDELEIVGRTLAGTTLRWEQLSAGAREQLAILSALAAAQLAGDDGVPFVLDDALGYTDPERLQRLGALLGRTSGAQVVVLTCMADRFRHVGRARTVRLLDGGVPGSEG